MGRSMEERPRLQTGPREIRPSGIIGGPPETWPWWKCNPPPTASAPELYPDRGVRLWAANEALSFGRGGVRAVAEALAISAKTIMQGKRELQGPSPHPDSVVVGGRQRRPGGGRKSILEKHPQLLAAIEQDRKS